FSALFGIRISFFLPDGTAIKRGIHHDLSGFCRCVDKKLNKRYVCLKLDKLKRQECSQKGRMICYTCHAGLIEAIAPVTSSGVLLGYIMIGQFRNQNTMPAEATALTDNTLILAELQKEYEALTCISPEKTKHMLFLFSALVDFIVASNSIAIRNGIVVQRIIDFIEVNCKRPISLAEVARHCCLSRTSVTHLFKNECGISFKTYCIRKRLEVAENYLRNRPEMTIGDISNVLGFSDQFHFSRLYRKYMGYPPSKVRN
ncbi:MAG: PocR ligand-binding domain-containing protein, partial [Fibrobacteres bacterium]|nr:PocR ligand-binding domain-containing protein [Fibrobacterota bacterium]